MYELVKYKTVGECYLGNDHIVEGDRGHWIDPADW